MIWEGAGYACKIDGRIDGDLHVKILDGELLDSIRYYRKTKDNIIFQQDNNPRHTYKKVSQWFEDYRYDVMSWPGQSTDLNPIEHLWNHLKRKLAEHKILPGTLGEGARGIE
jgi:hypothetical protein